MAIEKKTLSIWLDEISTDTRAFKPNHNHAANANKAAMWATTQAPQRFLFKSVSPMQNRCE